MSALEHDKRELQEGVAALQEICNAKVAEVQRAARELKSAQSDRHAALQQVRGQRPRHFGQLHSTPLMQIA